MAQHAWLPRAGALPLAAALALLALAPDADARGGHRGGGSASRSVSSHGSDSHGSSSGGRTIVIRSGSSDSGGSDAIGADGQPLPPGATPRRTKALSEMTPEEREDVARRAERAAAWEKAQAEKNAAQIAKAEAERQAAEELAAKRAAQKEADSRAEAARIASEADQKRRAEAAVVADVDRVLQRAMADYPVLRTADGQALLQSIQERQKALVAQGLYPSVAMTQAVAHHEYALKQRARAEAPVAPRAQAEASASTTPASGFGTCSWVTPTQWACR